MDCRGKYEWWDEEEEEYDGIDTYMWCVDHIMFQDDDLSITHLHTYVQTEKIDVSAPEGKTLLEVAHENDIELEGKQEEIHSILLSHPITMEEW